MKKFWTLIKKWFTDESNVVFVIALIFSLATITLLALRTISVTFFVM